MATARVDSYALFKNQEGWKAENRPSPYNTWTNTTNPAFCSCYNTSSSHAPTKLNAFCIRALLSICDRKNAEIGICRVTTGSYASQWTQPDGTVILASAQSNGALTAAIREQSGRHKTIPALGNKDTAFDPSSILALFILIGFEQLQFYHGRTATGIRQASKTDDGCAERSERRICAKT